MIFFAPWTLKTRIQIEPNSNQLICNISKSLKTHLIDVHANCDLTGHFSCSLLCMPEPANKTCLFANKSYCFNLLSPKRDKHQFSSNLSIDTLFDNQVKRFMRISKMITTRKMLYSIIKFSRLIL